MTNLTSTIKVDVPSEVKDEATAIFNNLGLNMSTAINMFLKKAIYEGGIPFEVKEMIDNNELLDSLKELDYMETHPNEYKKFHSVKELMGDLNSDN